ncbi:uncharacterized protein PV09_07805 [Verruconis gallopava]|uniref:PH domain-containing protein n=1 Tax=Verruconis gallopava TaxID=253628 RepID=A0A0D2A1M4_9PEZI|nr:uncharacterized protein PV09_07805 [Verruconis gallopava]KIW00608.1 hypothetical protein PV09_07805 [Verruconis gallopava]
MAPVGAISPLKINKSTPNASPAKMNSNSSVPRALTEVSPMSQRRNSPSYNQITKQMVGAGRDSSPFDSSPYGNSSPRAFWQKGASPARFGAENWLDRSDSSASMSKRPSIERLKQASRVKNSSMFAREQKNEYDPASPGVLERPLAANRPLSQLGGNAFGGRGVDGQRQEGANAVKGHRRGQSSNNIPVISRPSTDAPSTTTTVASNTPSPARSTASPTKSSLSSRPMHNTLPRNFNQNSAPWSDDDETETSIVPSRPLRRHAKSVTFDTKPPEINEYEMVTPDPSVASVASGSREGSYEDFDDDEYEIDLGGGPNEDEDSFDASLEDTEKTPVVLPEDWRHMSPEVGNNSVSNSFDDPFTGRGTPSQQWNAYRTASVNSDGDSRPLPPVPPFAHDEARPASPNTIAERVRAAHNRTLPNLPRPNGVSSPQSAGTKKTSMTLEDRLRLMGLQDSTSPRGSAAKEAARLRKHGLGIHVNEEEVSADDNHDNHYSPPHISRESVLRKVRSRTFDKSEETQGTFSEEPSYADLDPDVPIPSREASSNFDDVVPEEREVQIKEEDADDPIDLYAIPDMYAGDNDEDFSREGSVIRHDVSGRDAADDESCYSPEMNHETAAQQGSDGAMDEDGPPTPKQESGIRTSTPLHSRDEDQGASSLPEFSLLDDGEFQSGLASYLSNSSTPPPPPEKDNVDDVRASPPKVDMQSVQESMRQDASEEDNADCPGTPESVVHRPISPESESEVETPGIPEPQATVKAPGGLLKTRASATPADLQSMAAQRRMVSGQGPPPIPEKSPKRLSMSLEPAENQDCPEEKDRLEVPASPITRRQSFRGIDIGDDSFGEDISFGLGKELERVIESSKKGYLMRQNTKVVIAKRNFSNESSIAPTSPTLEQRPSSAGTRGAGGSPRKPSHERSKSWTTEPWNGKVRRKSIRNSGAVKRAGASGPLPPLPGQESAVSAGLDTVVEGQALAGEADVEDGVERGRLFVKVVGVKDLDLPLPQKEPTYFQLTLDNGLHCVTTSWLELGRTAPIGQEFELVVLNDLEFQLTLQTKLTPPPKPTPLRPNSPSKFVHKSPIKKTSFSHLLMSPKKRREHERLAKEKQEQEEAARAALEQESLRASRNSRTGTNPNATAWELLNELVGSDGSFGRAYVCLKNHENQCYGRPITVDMPVFNEWALEDAAIVNSVKSKRGGVVRRPPYQIGKLTLQLLYVPRPKGISDEDMPKSMNACIRELREAEEAEKREFEGFLSQQGGDCPYWRRRFFRLVGSKLTAYHETTRQPRAKIDLAKAVKLIDDRGSLVQNPEGGKSAKGRRKSGFAEEDEGYQFVEEGFRIRFGNGETIDFYADNAKDKAGWIDVLQQTIGKSVVSSREWCKVVLAREKELAALKAKAPENVQARPQSADGLYDRAQNMKQKANRLGASHRNNGEGFPVMPTTPSKPRREMFQTPQTAPHQGRTTERRKEVRSMIF